MTILQSLLAERRHRNVVQSQFRSDSVIALASTVSIQQSTSASKPLMAISRSLHAANLADAKRRYPTSPSYTKLWLLLVT